MAGAPFHTTRWTPAARGSRPLVVLLHGAGGPEFFLERPEYARYPEALAAAGFLVVMPHYAQAGAAPEAAVSRILDWLAQRRDVDVTRTGVVGFSRGGFIGSCLAGTDVRIAAFASCYGGLDADCTARIDRMPPTLVLHGEADPVVPVGSAAKLARFVRGRGARADVHTYPRQEHIFLGDALDDSVARIVAFFREHLPASPSAVQAAPDASTPRPPADAGTKDAASSCAVRGPSVTVAGVDRQPGALSIAVRGTATALVWQDGPIAKAVVLDEQGRPRAAPRALNEAGSYGATPAVFVAGEAFAVTYVHKYGPSLQGCDLVARVLSADGTPGEPAVLARSVCAHTGYPAATAAGDVVVAAYATGYEGRGLGIVRWPLAGAPERTATPGRAELTTPQRVAATPEGLVVVWSEDAEPSVHAGLRLDRMARPVGEPWRLPTREREAPWIVGGRLFWWRLRGGGVELLATDARRPTPWSAIDVGERARGARVVTTGGRAWVLAETSSGAHRVVPLAEDGTQAGPAWEVPAGTFAIDGSHGAAAELRSSPREVRWTALDCGTEHRRP